ncbi:MAG: hypothetical protein ABIO70_35430 [Pseudomonadota bacterium]
MRILFVVPLLALGCTPADPADPALALRELATANAEGVYNAIYDGIEAQDGIDLWNPGDGYTGSSSLALPAAGGEDFGLDGAIEVDWTLTWSEDSYVYLWDWTFAVDYAPLVLPSCEVTGAATWAMTYEYYDYVMSDHTFAGTVTLDDGEPLEVAYTAHWSGNLHNVQGSIGDVAVDWENPNPDLP